MEATTSMTDEEEQRFFDAHTTLSERTERAAALFYDLEGADEPDVQAVELACYQLLRACIEYRQAIGPRMGYSPYSCRSCAAATVAPVMHCEQCGALAPLPDGSGKEQSHG